MHGQVEADGQREVRGGRGELTEFSRAKPGAGSASDKSTTCDLTQNFGVTFQAFTTRAELAEGNLVPAGGEKSRIGSQSMAELAGRSTCIKLYIPLSTTFSTPFPNTLISGHAVPE